MAILPTGSSRCRCPACGLTFRSESGFDRHRVGPMNSRRCVTVAELAAAGWRLSNAGAWLMPNKRALPVLRRDFSALRRPAMVGQGVAL